MAISLRGITGEVRWSYHLAGTVREWLVAQDGSGGWTLTATVEQTDAFRVSQRPLTFVARHAKGAWTWPIRTLQIQDASLSAGLGPMET